MEPTNNDKSFKVDRSYMLELASKTRRIFEKFESRAKE